MKSSRRRFLGAALSSAALTGLGVSSRPAVGADAQRPLTPRRIDLIVDRNDVNFTGRTRQAITINGGLPAPTLRFREGDDVTIRVLNRLDEPTSIHWHGILLPANMDGVPGLSFDGIPARSAFTYRFRFKQSGTYWYHSHSMFQEQQGHYGALIVEPRNTRLDAFDREHVLLFSDWTDLDPVALFRRLKKMPGHDNWYRRTLPDFIDDVRRQGFAEAWEDRRMWNGMRMTPTDLSDVNGHTYTYLLNGRSSQHPWTGMFGPGERVLLRMINASAMTYFDIRIPGLTLTIVAADGQPVEPVTVDELRMGAAETYDVIIEPRGAEAFVVFAQDMGRTGAAIGLLQMREGAVAPVPALDPRALLGMQDMGHTDPSQTVHAAGHAGHHQSTAGNHVDHSAHGPGAGKVRHPASERGNPLVDMQVMQASPRLDDPGAGLRENGRKVLTYSMLHSRFEDPDGRDPGREIELHLTGHMEKFAWSFNGEPFAHADPIRLHYGERLRITLVNDTMMHHPIHLHGMWSDLEDTQGRFLVRKHTIDIAPGTRRSYRVRADALGRWAYHCHLLYHMESGMMREVRVDDA